MSILKDNLRPDTRLDRALTAISRAHSDLEQAARLLMGEGWVAEPLYRALAELATQEAADLIAGLQRRTGVISQDSDSEEGRTMDGRPAADIFPTAVRAAYALEASNPGCEIGVVVNRRQDVTEARFLIRGDDVSPDSFRLSFSPGGDLPAAHLAYAVAFLSMVKSHLVEGYKPLRFPASDGTSDELALLHNALLANLPRVTFE